MSTQMCHRERLHYIGTEGAKFPLQNVYFVGETRLNKIVFIW